MGVYDTLPNGSQVKCWGSMMRMLDVGSKVGKLGDKKDYIVLLREGGYVKVIKKKIVKISSHREKKCPCDFKLPVFDKWGDRVYCMNDLHGLLGPYDIEDKYYYCDN